MAAILNSAILNLAILDSTTLVFPLKLTHTCQDWFPPFAQKNFTHTSLPTICTKKTSLFHLDSTWWWQPSWILPSWIETPCFLLSDSLKNTLPPLWLWLKLIQSDSNSFILTQLDDGSHLEFVHLGFGHLSFSSQTHSHLPRLVPTICTKKSFTQSSWLSLMMAAILNSTMLDSDTAILDSDTFLSSLRFTPKHSPSILNLTQTNSIWLTWWWQPSWILPSWIQPFCTKLWLKLIQSDSNSFNLTLLDDGSHLEFCYLEFGHLGFNHLSFSSQTHSHMPRLVPTICTKKPSLIHSDSTWWWQPSWILPCWIQTPCFLLSDSLKNTLPPLWLWLKLIQSDSKLFILIQLDDGSHLEFCHLEFGHLGFSHLSFSSQTQSHLPRLVPTICTKKPSLIHSDSTWWWQQSWILPCWIKKISLIHSDSTWWWQPSWILPCWIQTPCFLLSDSLKNTLTPLWLWLKLI